MSKASLLIALEQARFVRDELNRASQHNPALIKIEHLIDSLKTALRSAA